MEINGIIIPDAGTKIETIADPIGGWLYTVKTTVDVTQKSLANVRQEITEAEEIAAEANARVEELRAKADDFEAQVIQNQVSTDL